MAEINYDASSHCYKCGEQWHSVLVCGCPKVTGPTYCVWVPEEQGASKLEDADGELIGWTQVVGNSEGIYRGLGE
jgi:hypothetical protein